MVDELDVVAEAERVSAKVRLVEERSKELEEDLR